MRLAKLTIALLVMTGPVFAQQGRLGARRETGTGDTQSGNFDALKEYLKLTPAQVADLQTIRTGMRDALKPLVEGLAPKVKALREALRQDPIDSEAVARLRKEVEDARSAIRAKREEFAAKARGVLTAEQVSSLQALDQALRLQRAAGQAAQLGFIEPPERMEGPLLRLGRGR